MIVRHTCISIEGVLANWNNRDIARLFGRSVKDITEIKRVLIDYLINGIKVLPIGEKCECWSDQTGCPGHEKDDES
jgi:hypothetical protein